MFPTGFISLNVLLLFPLSTHQPSAEVFAFGYFNLHHKDWLILLELIDLVNSDIVSNYLSQMVNFPTWIPDGDSHSPTLLDLFISSSVSICSIMAFSSLENSDHNFVSASIGFPSYLHWGAPFHCIAYDYFRADWDGLHDHLTDVPWEDIFKLSTSAAASEFCELVQVRIDVCIPHRKYQVKPHSSP